MREILFRGKQKNGEWAFGSLHIERGETDRNGKSNIDYRILGMRGECDYVIPETVGQWTGLVDKNGVKIFEGDLVVPTNRRRLANKASVVEYDPLSGYWMCSPAREPIVIGNIHDKAVEE